MFTKNPVPSFNDTYSKAIKKEEHWSNPSRHHDPWRCHHKGASYRIKFKQRPFGSIITGTERWAKKCFCAFLSVLSP